jgi:predicted esterase
MCSVSGPRVTISHAAVALLALAMLACSRVPSCTSADAKAEKNPKVSVIADAGVAAPVGTLEPLLSWHGVDTFPVPDWGDVVVWPPAGATSPRPIVLGCHGNAETPEAFCESMHGVVGSRAFVVCPRGTRPPDKNYPNYWFASPQALAIEVDADLAVLDKHYPGYVDKTAVLYIGFSRGAFASVGILATEPARYPRAILIEGGQDAWTPDRINIFGATGGKRILFVCGQEECLSTSSQVAVKLDQVGVLTRTVYTEGAGHVYTGAVMDNIRRGFEWVIEDDPRWSAR